MVDIQAKPRPTEQEIMTAALASARPFVVRLRHDRGQHTTAIVGHGDDARSAVATLLDIGYAPMRAVLWVKRRPLCACGLPATRYTRHDGDEAGQETPLCPAHARERYGNSRQVRAHTGELGITRFLVVDEAEWKS